MSSINNNQSILKIRAGFIRTLLIALIIEAVILMISLMTYNPSTTSIYSYDYTPYILPTQLQATFWVTVGLLIGTVLGFRSMQKGNKAASVLAIIGLCAGGVAALLQLLVIWATSLLAGSSTDVWLRLMLTGTVTAVTTIAISLVMCIDENGELIGFSKIISTISGGGFWLCALFMIFGGFADYMSLMTKTLPISGTFLACFVVSSIVALLLSRFNRYDTISEKTIESGQKAKIETMKSTSTGTDYIKFTNPEVAQIQEEEKKRLEKEKAERDAMPPLQADNMPPKITRDNQMVIGSNPAVEAPTPVAPTEPKVADSPSTQPSQTDSTVPPAPIL